MNVKIVRVMKMESITPCIKSIFVKFDYLTLPTLTALMSVNEYGSKPSHLTHLKNKK